MIKAIYICDKCKNETSLTFKSAFSFTYPAGWHFVTTKIMGTKVEAEYFLCPNCCNKLGLNEPNNQNTQNENKSIADRLIECIEEIVESFMEGQK